MIAFDLTKNRKGSPSELVRYHSSMIIPFIHCDVLTEMTNQYMTAFAKDPIIRAAIMQSADSEYRF